MSEYISRCYRCQAPNPAWGMTICAACRQVDALEAQTEAANSRAEREAEMYAQQSAANARRMEEQNQEAMRIAENNARLAREQAKENAILAAESGVSYDDAYTYGLNYLASGETTYLLKSLSEDGVIIVRPDKVYQPYKMVHLNQAFDRGLTESAKDIVSPGLAYMKERAFEAGVKTQDSFTIKCNTGSNITNHYRSNMKRHISIVNGEVSYHWDNPFKSKELNDAYAEGVNFFIQEENANTPEKIAARMDNEVVLMRAERDAQNVRIEQERVATEQQLIADRQQWETDRIRIIKEADQLTVICVAGFVMLLAAVVFLWNANHGFIAFLVAIGLVVGGGIIGSKYDDMFGRAQDLKKYPQCPY
jgi:hypothetical protein